MSTVLATSWRDDPVQVVDMTMKRELPCVVAMIIPMTLVVASEARIPPLVMLGILVEASFMGALYGRRLQIAAASLHTAGEEVVVWKKRPRKKSSTEPFIRVPDFLLRQSSIACLSVNMVKGISAFLALDSRHFMTIILTNKMGSPSEMWRIMFLISACIQTCALSGILNRDCVEAGIIKSAAARINVRKTRTSPRWNVSPTSRYARRTTPRNLSKDVVLMLANSPYYRTRLVFALSRETVDEPGWECPICMDADNDGITETVLPCQHVIHPTCLAVWTFMQSSRLICPVCQQKIWDAED